MSNFTTIVGRCGTGTGSCIGDIVGLKAGLVFFGGGGGLVLNSAFLDNKIR